ncbi:MULTISPECIES: hypothetical protein [unclassified Curtobacterium]|uniref:hypothetical protein n=1 Tax=unclassified Curtobacterium TaxID=257496 RepID=UPI000DA8DEA2|nr:MULTISPECIES: hypothetical protein [unclassified Curtobacterium]PZE23990.1 hypothetical protein DEI86_13165 [Curtobacterium sp. MCBD17_028]PZF56897.1 hypothetical protein DEI92_14055 [Curtobacterium sp. MCBD17_034]PZF60589.1 hypothetical protein DEI81_12285 [Curtobacterium sp. MCBD17_013]PZM33853.1 hypothetical protein DEI90_11440 [Curtobacterium sp. MCBD17_031]WIB64358.1 hypothetical protein DEI94_03955 [Curtobacterium sp. MCBD17_040]
MGRRREDRWSPPEHPESPRPDAFSLSEDARGGDPCHAVTPIPVWAWIQFPSFHVRVKAFARSWTVDAVLVEWAQFGHPAEAWVWRSAVKHRTLREDDRRTRRVADDRW